MEQMRESYSKQSNAKNYQLMALACSPSLYYGRSRESFMSRVEFNAGSRCKHGIACVIYVVLMMVFGWLILVQ